MEANQVNQASQANPLMGATYEVESSFISHVGFGHIALGMNIRQLPVILVALQNGTQYLYVVSSITHDLVESMVIRHVENGDISVGQVFNTYLRHCDHHRLEVPLELPTSEEEEYIDPEENLPVENAAVTWYRVHSPFIATVRIDRRFPTTSVYVTGLSGNEVRFWGFTEAELQTLHAILQWHDMSPTEVTWGSIYSKYIEGRHG